LYGFSHQARHVGGAYFRRTVRLHRALWVYESGFGPYQCGFIDAGHLCNIFEYGFNKMFIANLVLGLPTIVSGLISLFVVRSVTKHWSI